MPRDFEIEVGTYDGIDVEKIASEELFKASLRAQEHWRKNLHEGQGALGSHGHPYEFTGESQNDITISPQTEGALEYVVGGDVVQLAVAEFGRAPGSPPPRDAIATWARLKGLVPREGETFDEMVAGLRWHIAKHGLKAFAPAQLAADTVNLDLEERIRARIEAAQNHAADEHA